MTNQAIILFHTSTHAFRAERLLLIHGMKCQLMPVPHDFVSECSVCLRLEATAGNRAIGYLVANQIEIAGMRPCQ